MIIVLIFIWHKIASIILQCIVLVISIAFIVIIEIDIISADIQEIRAKLSNTSIIALTIIIPCIIYLM
jgi:hypothetical protein